MPHPLTLYREQLALLNKERAGLDSDIAQVLAEAILAGHNIHDLLPPPVSPAQKVFDL